MYYNYKGIIYYVDKIILYHFTFLVFSYNHQHLFLKYSDETSGVICKKFIHLILIDGYIIIQYY